MGGALNIVKIITDKGLVLSYTYASHQHHPWSATACQKKRGLHIWSAAGKRGEERREIVAEPPKLLGPHAPVTVQRPLITMHMFQVT